MNKDEQELFVSKLGNAENTNDVISVLERLEPEPYSDGRMNDFKTKLLSGKRVWDICSVLTLYSKTFNPASYAEIGVRRGKSMACVLSFSKYCSAYGFDMWIPQYGGVPNPGPDLVRSEMKKLGYEGNLFLIKGNSHTTVPAFIKEHQPIFDLVLVDGDHSPAGAMDDLKAIQGSVRPGGLLVFDDIYGDNLLGVWNNFLDEYRDFFQIAITKDFTGTAVAIRRIS